MDEDIKKIYRDFARLNHPDTLSANTSDEVRDVAQRVYGIVSDAYEILTNKSKRQKLIENLEINETKKRLRAEMIAEKSIDQLKRGRAKDALGKLQESYELYPTTNNLIYLCWAKLKSHIGNIPEEIQQEVQDKLQEVPHEERRSADYLFVIGLLKKAAGDFEGAQAQLDKVLMIDPNFLDARREISSLKSALKNSSSNNIFSDDLGSFVGRLFKKQNKK